MFVTSSFISYIYVSMKYIFSYFHDELCIILRARRIVSTDFFSVWESECYLIFEQLVAVNLYSGTYRSKTEIID